VRRRRSKFAVEKAPDFLRLALEPARNRDANVTLVVRAKFAAN
jgi:hypothetical protein